MFLRLLIPSWRLFEDYELEARIYYRLNQGEWTFALSRNPRKISSLFVNAEENFLIAHIQLVHQLRLESERPNFDIEQSVPFLILKNFVRDLAVKDRALFFRFKICFEDSKSSQEFLISPEYRV